MPEYNTGPRCWCDDKTQGVCNPDCQTIAERDHWKRRYETQHRRVHEMEDVIARYRECLVDLAEGWVGNVQAKAERALNQKEEQR